MAVIMVYNRRDCRIMLVFHWLLQILLKLTVFILSVCVGLLTNNFLLLLLPNLMSSIRLLSSDVNKKEVYILMHYHETDYMLDDPGF